VSSDIFTTSTELAILTAGRTPVWSTEDDSGSDLPPSAADSGVYLQRAVRALVHVSLRENVAYRSVRLTTTTVLTGTYTVTVDGNAVAYNATVEAPADINELLEGIAEAVNDDVTVGALVTASIVTQIGGDDFEILITGVGEADYSVDFTHSSTGSPTLTAVADRCSATMRLWWLPDARVGSTPPQIWAWSGDVWTLDRRGWLERFDVAGLARLHVQLSDRAGHAGDSSIVTYAAPAISIGPCLSESDT